MNGPSCRHENPPGAAISLARLWRRQGKRDAARALLATPYAWFTEASTRATWRPRRRCSTTGVEGRLGQRRDADSQGPPRAAHTITSAACSGVSTSVLTTRS